MAWRSVYEIAKEMLGPELALKIMTLPNSGLILSNTARKIAADQERIRAAFERRQRTIDELKKATGIK